MHFEIYVQVFVGYAYFVITAEKQRLKSCIQASWQILFIKSEPSDQDVDTVAALTSTTELGLLRSKRFLKTIHFYFHFLFSFSHFDAYDMTGPNFLIVL